VVENQLQNETSPYLRQHADNPVAWWPWGEAAFSEAKRRNVPVFVSIGYAACHWCHVMAHESFEDAQTAKLMNERFVNIKVDREERPEVDAVYMNAIMVQGEGGGWPLSAFCMPDGRPFYLGTYFPKQPRYGRPSFSDMLTRLSDAYQQDQDKLLENADALMEGLVEVDAHYRGKASANPVAIDLPGWISQLSASQLIAAGREITERCDAKHGGLRGKPKFPSSSTHDLLMRTGRLPFGEAPHKAAVRWAEALANGGIYDHVAGGFARYSVDEMWLVPHFEKMLSDQGQLLSMMADAFANTGAARFAEVIVQTTAFLQREMMTSSGGLASSLDADTEGHEGKFYVWTRAELQQVLGSLGSLHVATAYGVTDEGNFEHGAAVLSRVTSRGTQIEESQLREHLDRLFVARQQRVRPGVDDKVLAGWNGLVISGLVAGWKSTAHEPALALALALAQFVATQLIENGMLSRMLPGSASAVRLPGTLDDYAFVASAMLDVADATADAAWFALARQLVDRAMALFVTEVNGALAMYLSAPDPLLVHRTESHSDGALPSGAAVLIDVMLRIALIADDQALLATAERYLAERIVGSRTVSPLAQPRLLAALDRYLHGSVLVVSPGTGRVELMVAARSVYAPTLMIAGPHAAAHWREDKNAAVDGRAQAFLCRGQSCSAPVTGIEALRALLTA
jgi:uncharacterized protein